MLCSEIHTYMNELIKSKEMTKEVERFGGQSGVLEMFLLRVTMCFIII